MKKTALAPRQKVGLLDSGVGGLSILNALLPVLAADYVYVADAAHLPYGEKTPEFLLERGLAITRFLQAQNISTIFVTCHTLSATVLHKLKVLVPEVQYVDMIPPTIIKAVHITRNNRIGIMATSATIKTGIHKKLLETEQDNLIVTEQACQQFVPLIENNSSEALLHEAIHTYLQPLMDQSVDTIILGCTHYPFIQPLLEKMAPTITFVSAANALSLCIPEGNYEPMGERSVRFVTTASHDYLATAVSRYFVPYSGCTFTLETKKDLILIEPSLQSQHGNL